MNKQIDAIARSLRKVLMDEETKLCEIDRETLESCYIDLEKLAIRERPSQFKECIGELSEKEQVEEARVTKGVPF